MSLATFTFAVINVFVKMLPRLGPTEIVFFRSLVVLIYSGSFLIRHRIKPKSKNIPILILRGLFGTIALILFFYTLQSMKLATAMVVHYLSPFFTVLIASIFLGEVVRKYQFLFLFISLMGILLVKEFDSHVAWKDVIFGVLAAIISGAAYNTIRKLKDNEHSYIIMIAFPVVALPISVLLLWINNAWVTPIGIEWVYLLVIGLLSQGAQYFLTKAYQHHEINKVAIVTYSGIVYSFFFGWVYFDDVFTMQTLLGIALILGGVVLNVLYVRRLDRAKVESTSKDVIE
jgi:drug/metabolite transporter (DMT)-like permease